MIAVPMISERQAPCACGSWSSQHSLHQIDKGEDAYPRIPERRNSHRQASWRWFAAVGRSVYLHHQRRTSQIEPKVTCRPCVPTRVKEGRQERAAPRAGALMDQRSLNS